MLRFTYRTLKVFFRDRVNVFFSLMAVAITVGIYILFLRDVWLKYAAGGLENGEELMDAWLMGGMLSIIPVTSVLGAFSVLVDDRQRGIDRDLICSPLSGFARTGGYLLAVFSVGLLISLFGLGLAQWYISAGGGALLTVTQLFRVLGVLAYSTAFSTVALYVLVSFFRSQGAFLTATVVIGVAIGFLTGCYVPVGFLPEGVQTLVKWFPPSHSASLLRKIFMEKPLDVALSGEPGFWFGDIKEFLGVDYRVDGVILSSGESLLFIGLALSVFLLLAAVRTLITSIRRS